MQSLTPDFSIFSVGLAFFVFRRGYKDGRAWAAHFLYENFYRSHIPNILHFQLATSIPGHSPEKPVAEIDEKI